MHSMNGRRESHPTMTRRGLVRRCRHALYAAAAENWKGTRSGLRRRVRELIKPMRARIDLMLRVVREAHFAALVAGAVLASAFVDSVAAAAIDIGGLVSSSGGQVFRGEAASAQAGYSLSAAGDVNGDGLADVIIGAHGTDANAVGSGRSYVVFGDSPLTNFELSDIANGTGGFAIDGEALNDLAGYSVSGGEDVNGDGLDDLIIGARLADPNGAFSGRSYVVFGKADTTKVQLSDIVAGTGGFALDGEDIGDTSGRGVSMAGDFNGDGLADVIIGASSANPNGQNSGRSYLVFGKADTTLVQLSDVANGTGGFAINGAASSNYAGRSLSAAGDVNGDGLSDLLIGGYSRSYVLFGTATGTLVELSSVAAGTGGFEMVPEFGAKLGGRRVSGAGDVNGDGLADLIVGSSKANPNGVDSGRSYVVFGKASGTPVQLSDVTAGNGGFAIDGEATNDMSGRSVSGAGDINGDGLGDLLIGRNRSKVFYAYSGRCYLVFGKADGARVQLSDVTDGVGGFTLATNAIEDGMGRSISGAGDVNGDGLADFLVGASNSDPNGSASGRCYLVFSPETAAASGTYIMKTRPGDGAGGNIVTETELPPGLGDVARAKIDFSDGDTGDNGSGGASTETITITRSKSGITNLTPISQVADVVWQITTDRTGFTDAKVTLKYLGSEISGISGAEDDLAIFTAAAASGPWTKLTTAVDSARNEASATVTGFSFFAIGNGSSVVVPTPTPTPTPPPMTAVENWDQYQD